MTDIAQFQETQLATQSENSRGWLHKQMANLTATTSASDVLKQFARLAANYGDQRIATTEQRTLLLREWMEAFGNHSPSHLHEAVSVAMKATKFWPTIAEVAAEVSEIRREAVSVVGAMTGTGRHVAVEIPFARDGRTEAEEIAYRAAQSLRWKQQFGFGKHTADEDVREQKPASQDTSVSYALLNSCAVRRSKGLDTCQQDCSRRSCELRGFF